MMESLRDSVITLLRGSLDTRTATAGTPVAGATQVIASGDWGFKEFVPITNQNGDGSAITVNSVTGSTDGALIDEDDYLVVVDKNGVYGVAFSDASATTLTTESQTMTIDYDYTPSASVKRASGDKTDLDHFMIKITTLNDDKAFYWVGLYGNIKTGFNFEYSKDDDDDRRDGSPMELEFKPLPSGSGATADEGLVWYWVQTDGY
jgi:hypothetical protein